MIRSWRKNYSKNRRLYKSKIQEDRQRELIKSEIQLGVEREIRKSVAFLDVPKFNNAGSSVFIASKSEDLLHSPTFDNKINAMSSVVSLDEGHSYSNRKNHKSQQKPLENESLVTAEPKRLQISTARVVEIPMTATSETPMLPVKSETTVIEF